MVHNIFSHSNGEGFILRGVATIQKDKQNCVNLVSERGMVHNIFSHLMHYI
jgi:hypothetical protein